MGRDIRVYVADDECMLSDCSVVELMYIVP